MKRIHKALALALGTLLALAAPLAALAYDVFNYQDLVDAASSNDTIINIRGNIDFGANDTTVVFNRSVDIIGETDTSGNALWTITGNDIVALIQIQGNATVENLTLTHGYESGGSGGGALFVIGNAEITNCTFTLNESTNDGGAVYVSGTVDIENSTFTNNQAAFGGGAISSGGDISVAGSTFTDNQAGSSGGAIWGDDKITIDNSIFTGNDADRGGAVYSDGNDTITVTDSTFEDNTATSSGGAIFVQAKGVGSPTEPTATIVGSTFTGNQAGLHGGGIYAGADVKIEDSIFKENHALSDDGGAMRVSGGADISGSTFDSNTAGNQGGAVWVGGGSSSMPDSTIRDSDFYDNTSGAEGGSLYSRQDLTIEGTNYFDGNTPSGNVPNEDPSGSIYMVGATGATLNVPGDIILGRRPVPPPRGGSGTGPGGGTSAPVTGQPAMIGHCKEWVNVREGSGENSDIIGRAYAGEMIWLLQWNSDGTWCKALYNGRNNAGWVSGQFIVTQ